MDASTSMQLADLRRPPPPPIAWVRRHPIVVDVVVVLLAYAPHLFAAVFRGSDFPWWGYPFMAVGAAALLFRRRWPLTILAIMALSCAFSPLAIPGAAFPMIPFAFALYTVASLQPLRRALIGFAIGLIAPALATLPYSLAGERPPNATPFDPFILVALLIGVLVRSRREQQERMLALVNERIENAALMERTRIAAEMHDVVAHSLTVIVSLADGATSIRAKQPERADAAVEQIASVGRGALEDMHRTLDLLRNADAGLDANLHHSGDNLPSLEDLVEGFRSAGLPVELRREGDPLPQDLGLHQAIYRIVQESLTNTLRHADAPSGATVTIGGAGERVVIRVEDDGRRRRVEPVAGHGLTGIEQRARAFGGHSTAGPAESANDRGPGNGWVTTAELLAPKSGRGERQ